MMNHRHGIALGLSLLMAANMCTPVFAAEDMPLEDTAELPLVQAAEGETPVEMQEAEPGEATDAPQPGDTAEIASAEDFAAFASFVTADADHGKGITWKLTGNIDLGTHTPVPVFSGTLDGGGHTITANATVSGGEVGLFAQLDGAVIQNLTLNVTATGSGAAGALAAQAADTTVSNCEVSDCSISGGADVGGLIGRAEDCEVTDCTNTAAVNGAHDVGGLIGEAEDTTVEWSHCGASVSGQRGGIGGLVGRLLDGTVAYSWFDEGANVSGSHVEAIGGIAGGSEGSVTVHDCYVQGNVSGGGLNIAGGIVGANLDMLHALDISNCYMTGSVSSGAAICGFSLRGTVVDCVYTGDNRGWFGTKIEEAALKAGEWMNQNRDFWKFASDVFPTLARQQADVDVQPTISIDVQSKEYDGTPVRVTVSITGSQSVETAYIYRQILSDGTVVDLDSAPTSVGDYSVQVSIPGTSVTAPFSITAKTLSLSAGSSEADGTVYTVSPETSGEYAITLPKSSGADGFRILFTDPVTRELIEETTVYSSGVSVYLDAGTTYSIIPVESEAEAK